MWAKHEGNQQKQQAIQAKEFIPQIIPSNIPLSKNPNAKPPTMPPPDAVIDNENKNKFIQNIASIGNAHIYPSMDPNYMVMKKYLIIDFIGWP